MRTGLLGLAGAGIFVAILLAGCQPPGGDVEPLAEWISRDPAAWRASPGSATHSARTLAGQSRQAGATQPELLGPVAGVEDYVRVALHYNPGIIAAEQRVGRLAERVVPARSLDDPMLMVAPIGQMAQTAAGQVGTMTSISQRLPLPAKLDARGQIATREAAMAEADLAAVRLAVVADTRRAYWSYYFSTRAIAVTNASRDLLAQLKQNAEARYRVGTANQEDVLRASVELSNLDNELITLGQRRTTAGAMLNSLMDRPVTAALPSPAAVRLSEVAFQLDQLLAAAADANPALKRIQERIEGERQRLRLARLARVPDLTVSLNYNFVEDAGLARMTRNGEDQWWVGFTVNVPIWLDKLAAGEREARRGILESAAEMSNEQNRIAFRVQDAWVRVETQQRLAVLFRDVIIPQARQTVDASASSYRAGKADFLMLVDNWRKLLNFELMFEQSLAALEQNLADLEQAVGRDLARPPAAATTRPDAG